MAEIFQAGVVAHRCLLSKTTLLVFSCTEPLPVLHHWRKWGTTWKDLMQSWPWEYDINHPSQVKEAEDVSIAWSHIYTLTLSNEFSLNSCNYLWDGGVSCSSLYPLPPQDAGQEAEGRGQDRHARAGGQSQGHSQFPECGSAACEPLQVWFGHFWLMQQWLLVSFPFEGH